MLHYIFAAYPFCLIAVALAVLWRPTPGNLRQFSLAAATCGSITLFAFLTAPWAFTSYHLRYASAGLVVVAVVLRWRHVPPGHPAKKTMKRWQLAALVLALVLFGFLDVLAIAARRPPENPLDLSFPLHSGTYYVLQGGDSAVTNPFHAMGGRTRVLDIVELNAFGNRATGIAPRLLNAYEIYGRPVYSPCPGEVVAVRTSVPDNPPGTPDTRHPEGNYVVLKCGDCEVFIAHLKKGSTTVAAGEVVAAGEEIGCVGNSGNSLEPHMHIGATRGGTETGLTFSRRVLVANDLWK